MLLEHMTATLKLLVVGILHECENVYNCCEIRQLRKCIIVAKYVNTNLNLILTHRLSARYSYRLLFVPL